jgi:DNA polymerase delta subunit 1
MKFMVLSWYTEDLIDDTAGGGGGGADGQLQYGEYTIYAFGVNRKGKSCCLRINGFYPSLYIKVPLSWSSSMVESFVHTLKKTKMYNQEHLLVNYKLVQRKDAYGYDPRVKSFLRLQFSSERMMTKIRYMFRNNISIGSYNDRFEVYNGSNDTLLRFMHIRHILAAGWIHGTHLSDFNDAYTDVAGQCHWKHVKPLDRHLIPPFKVLSFDIECFSSTREFPNPENEKDVITQIGSTVWRFQTEGVKEVSKTVFVLGESMNEIPDVEIVSCKNEKSVIKQWCHYLYTCNPDVIVGYNIQGFDWRYIHTRASLLHIDGSMASLTRLKHVPGELKEHKLMAKMSQGRSSYTFTIPGILEIEVYEWFRKNTKLDSYKLDHVAEHYLNEHKRPVSPQEIFEMSGPETGTPESRQTVADYCAQDTLLPIRLLSRQCVLPNLVEMSKCTHVPIHWILMRGQQIKVLSQMYNEFRMNDYLLPDIRPSSETVEGGMVLDCHRGYYTEPLVGLDYKSLYPSIIIAHNLCITTYVRESVKKQVAKDSAVVINTYDQHSFVQNYPGILPTILRRLWDLRLVTKKEMKQEKDPSMKVILDAKQLAIKVSMNSIYGVFGANSGPLCVKAIASTTTFIGRSMISQTKEYIETTYNGENDSVKGEVRYGDSVPGDTPITLRLHDKIVIPRRIDSVNATKWMPMRDALTGQTTSKEYSLPDRGTMTWSSNGWVEILRIIRHKAPKKKLYRITTQMGVVVVTEDHSLLTPEGKKVKPTEVSVGDPLLHRFIDQRVLNRNTTDFVQERQRRFYRNFESGAGSGV